MACPDSVTGQYLSGKRSIPVPVKRRKGNGNTLKIVKATQNNLKGVNATIRLGTLTVVTGVSGSGKSSLVTEVLTKGVEHALGKLRVKPGACREIQGLENIDKLVVIGQEPIGHRGPTLRRIQAYSMTSGICLHRHGRRSFWGTTREGFPSM